MPNVLLYKFFTTREVEGAHAERFIRAPLGRSAVPTGDRGGAGDDDVPFRMAVLSSLPNMVQT
jgi:hypothetical protein